MQEGVSKTGNSWTKREVVIEQADQNPMYPRKVCITFFGERAKMLEEFSEGMDVVISADVESRDYNGRWYTNVNGWRIGLADSSASVTGNPGVSMSDISNFATTPSVQEASISQSEGFSSESADDLPF